MSLLQQAMPCHMIWILNIEFAIFRIFFSLDMGHENVSCLNERCVIAYFGAVLSVSMFTAGEHSNCRFKWEEAEHNLGEIPLLLCGHQYHQVLVLRWST